MTYGLFTYHKNEREPRLRITSTDYEYLLDRGEEWERLKTCEFFAVLKMEND